AAWRRRFAARGWWFTDNPDVGRRTRRTLSDQVLANQQGRTDKPHSAQACQQPATGDRGHEELQFNVEVAPCADLSSKGCATISGVVKIGRRCRIRGRTATSLCLRAARS